MLIDDFNNAKIGNPFETLGLQKVEGKEGYLLRAWLPDAPRRRCNRIRQ